MASQDNFDFLINNMMVLGFIGLCIKLFAGSVNKNKEQLFKSDGSNGPATAAVWGYSILALSMLGLMLVGFALTSKAIGTIGGVYDQSLFKFIGGLISSSFPTFLTILIVMWLVTINATFYQRINRGMVATEFYRFSNATTVLMIFQLIAMYYFLQGTFKLDKLIGLKDAIAEQRMYNDRYSFAVYFLSFLNIILIGIMNVELKYFSTDG
jgi:hypothetical protein